MATGYNCFGQDPFHIIYDVNDGLPSSEVYDVELDKYNNLWFSTDRGISRYNGYEFENFTTEDGLTDNTIFEIIKDNDDNLWFSCYDGSVCYYDYESFKKAPFNDKLKPYIIRNWLRQINFDDKGNCYFFIGKTTSYDNNSCYFKYDFSNDSLYCIQPETKNEILKIGDNETTPFYYINEHNYYTHLSIKVEDQLLLGLTPENNYMSRKMSEEKDLGRHQFNSNVLLYRNDQKKVIFDQELELVKMYKDEFDKVWLITNKGLLQLNDFGSNIDIKYYFQDYSCSSMIEDSENNIWITTIDKGVVLIPAIYIKHYDNSHFNNSRVMSLKTLDNHIVTSNFNGDVFSISPDMDIDKIVSLKDRFLEIEKFDDYIYTCNNDKIYEKNKRVVTDNINIDNDWYSKVFLKLDEEYFLKTYHSLSWNEIKSDNSLNPISSIYTDTKVTCIYKSENNKIWIGTLDGIYWIPDYKQDLSYCEKIKEFDHLGRISTISESLLPILYIGTIGQGLHYFSKKDSTVREVSLEGENNASIINCLYEENDTTLWLGSNIGLFQYNIKYENDLLNLNLTNQFTIQSGLSSNFVYDVLKWMDKIWLVSEKGLNIFHTEDIPENIKAPIIYFDSISCNNKLLDFKSNATLSNEDKNLHFNFSSNSFKNKQGYPFYKYSLIKSEGDTIWKYTNNRTVQYTNISPASYEFIVQSRNQLNNWSEVPAKFKFTINPHFTQTIFFRLLLIISIMIFSYIIYWYRIRQLIHSEFQKRKLQATEMRAQKAELDVLRGQMNPHFIFNALNSIQNYFYKGNEEQANYYITKFSKLMRSSLEMSKLERITIEEEINFLTNYLDLEKMRFNN